MYNWQY